MGICRRCSGDMARSFAILPTNPSCMVSVALRGLGVPADADLRYSLGTDASRPSAKYNLIKRILLSTTKHEIAGKARTEGQKERP